MPEFRTLVGTFVILVGCSAEEPHGNVTSEPPAAAEPAPPPPPTLAPEHPSFLPEEPTASVPSPPVRDPRSRAVASAVEEADSECSYVAARIGPTFQADLDECVQDEDCGLLAVCTTGDGHRVCVPRCETHDDCATGERCACAGRQASFGTGRYGMCLPALCRSSEECGDGLRCLVTNHRADPSAPPLSFVCETVSDECDCYSPVWATPSCSFTDEGRKLVPIVG